MQNFLDVEFDTETEEASPPFVLIPSGRYTAEIVSAMAGSTKNGKGDMVVLNWSITEGEYENRTIFQNILVEHESAEARKFGRQKFMDVLTALGIKGKVGDLTVMLNKPCLIGVKINRDKNGQYPDRNEIGRVTRLPASHNGPTREAIKEAQKTQPTFKAVNGELNDTIPF